MDVVCDSGDWDVCMIAAADGQIQGALPYYLQKKMGFRLIRMPVLTPYLGPIIRYPLNIEKKSRIYGFEKKVVKKLFLELPSFDFFNQHFPPDYKNPLPIHWSKYNVHAMCNYRLELEKSQKEIFSGFDSKTRNEIRKAEKLFSVQENDNLAHFYELQIKTFSHNNYNVPFEYPLLEKIDQVLSAKKMRTITTSVSGGGEIAAAVYSVMDQSTIYTLMIGSDPHIRAGGAVQIAIWEVIKKWKNQYDRLDFCGSQIERIERVFRAFGAEQHIYFKVSKVKNPILKLSRLLTGKPK